MNLKIKLLKTGIFIDNSYLDDYVNLIIRNKNSSKKEGYIELHHIIPRKYYKSNNLEVDDSEENIVELYYKDHVKAHGFLFNCSKGYLKKSSYIAYILMVGKFKFNKGNKILKPLTDFELDEIQKNLDILKEDDETKFGSNYELSILKEYYPKEGGRKVNEILPHRSEETIQSKCLELGIKQISHGVKDYEVEIVKKYYPIGGYKLVQTYLPNRSKNSIQGIAAKLGIMKSKSPKGTAEEINILVLNYNSMSKKECAKLFPNRTPQAVFNKAAELKLRKSKKNNV